MVEVSVFSLVAMAFSCLSLGMSLGFWISK